MSSSFNTSCSFNTSKTILQYDSKNTSGCAKKVKLNSKDSLSFQQGQNMNKKLIEPLNQSNQAERVGLDSSLLQTLHAQMKENSLNNQSSLNLNQENLKSFEGRLTDPINEEEKSSENLEVLSDSFNGTSEDFEKEEGSQHLDIKGSLKSGVNNNTTDILSDIEKAEDDVSEADDDEKAGLKETTEIIEKTRSPAYKLVKKLVKKLNALQSKAIDGQLIEAYDGLILLKQGNPEYFEEGPEDFFSVKYYETLILFLCGYYKEALPGLLAMEKFYGENKDYMKIGIDVEDEKVGDNDIGALYHKIGKCCSELGNPLEGTKYLEKALFKLQEYYAKDLKKQPFLLMTCHCSLTQHYLKYEDGGKAKKHSKNALRFARKLKGQEWGMAPINQSLARCYTNRCDAFSFSGNQEKAQEKLNKAINSLNEYLNGSGLESHHMEARIKRSQAQIYWKNNQYDSAIELYEKAIDIIRETMPQSTKLKEDYLDELLELKNEKEFLQKLRL